MTWTGGTTKATGDVITAAIWNSYMGASGSIDDTAPAKVTTAGDVVYATGANALSRLGIGSAGQVLKTNAGATAPEWGAIPATDLTAGNHKVFYSNGSGTITSWSRRDCFSRKRCYICSYVRRNYRYQWW